MRLLMVGFWLVLGAAILFREIVTGDTSWMIHLAGLRFSPAWIAFVLAGYNLLRWWMDRTARAQQRELYELERKRQALHRLPRTEEEEPNPDFDFGKRPPGAE